MQEDGLVCGQFLLTSDVQSSNRIAYPTVSPSSEFISSDTRLATDMAATLLGCVQPTIPYLVYPSSCKYYIGKQNKKPNIFTHRNIAHY